MTEPTLSEQARQRLESMLGLAWQQVVQDHPRQARRWLRNNSRPPIEPAMAILPEDAAYRDLVAMTETETDVAKLFEAVAPVLTDLLVRALTVARG